MKANAGSGGNKLERARECLQAAGQRASDDVEKMLKRKVEADILASEKLNTLRNKN